MRKTEVLWRTFESELPDVGTRIVVEVVRPSIWIRTGERSYKAREHRSECVRGTFQGTIKPRLKDRLAIVELRNRSRVSYPMMRRWYPEGSEKLCRRVAAKPSSLLIEPPVAKLRSSRPKSGERGALSSPTTRKGAS